MEYLIGVILAAFVFALGRLIGFDRDRAFYTTVLIVVGTYYVLFAAMGASTRAMLIESLVSGAFLVIAAAGFKKNLWIVAAGLAGHGIFDFLHHLFIENPGMPLWWPGFCGAYDVVAGGLLALLLIKHAVVARTA